MPKRTLSLCSISILSYFSRSVIVLQNKYVTINVFLRYQEAFMVDMANASWRDSARKVRFFIFDCSAAFPLLIWLVHMRIWTFILAIVGFFFFGLLNRFGFTFTIFFRWLRQLVAGPRKISRILR